MNRTLKYVSLALALSAMSLQASAEVKLSHVLASHMVVQREATMSLWGTADPDELVTVKVKNAKELSDVLSGDVLLCSGQSNMELPVNRVTDAIISNQK